VRLSCAAPFLSRGQIARIGTLLREAEQLARDVDDRLRLVQALRWLGNVSIHDGEYARAAEYEVEVLRVATALGDAESRIGAANLLGQALGALGRYREAITSQGRPHRHGGSVGYPSHQGSHRDDSHRHHE
jgi:tetratricopeptide (TPR) repeat protein